MGCAVSVTQLGVEIQTALRTSSGQARKLNDRLHDPSDNALNAKKIPFVWQEKLVYLLDLSYRCSIIAAPDGAGEGGDSVSCIFAHYHRVRQKFRAFGWILCYGASLILTGALAHVVCCGLLLLILMRVGHESHPATFATRT